MTGPDDILRYHSDLARAFNSLRYHYPVETALGCVGGDVREMILSYLSDASSFREGHDGVNEYASLTYLHGWLDAGIFLGFFSGDSPSLFLPDTDLFPSDELPRLTEKTLRYRKMLTSALQSVEIAPESGCRLYPAAMAILDQAKMIEKSGNGYQNLSLPLTRMLGLTSFEYGRLDAGLRAGLFRILANPGLFTTETCRVF